MCLYFHGHQKGAHIRQRGAIQGAPQSFVGSSCPKPPPPASPTGECNNCYNALHLRSLLKTQSKAAGIWQCTTTKRASPHGLKWRHNNQSARKRQNQSLPEFPCLEAYNLANLARCAEQFHKYFHGNIFYQISTKNRIWWVSCQLTFKLVND